MSWSQDDVALALAWQAERNNECGGCGHPRDESFDPNVRWDAEPLVCHACAAKVKAEKPIRDDNNADGLYSRAFKRD